MLRISAFNICVADIMANIFTIVVVINIIRGSKAQWYALVENVLSLDTAGGVYELFINVYLFGHIFLKSRCHE